MREVCAADLKRQIRREGRRWRLVPTSVVMDDRVFVGALSPVREARDGLGTMGWAPVALCSIDAAHPFANVLAATRRPRGRRTLLDDIEESERAVDAAEAAQRADRDHTVEGDIVRLSREPETVDLGARR